MGNGILIIATVLMAIIPCIGQDRQSDRLALDQLSEFNSTWSAKPKHTMGEPFYLNRLTSPQLSALAKGASIRSLSAQPQILFYPIINSESKFVQLIRIDQTIAEWIAAGIGFSDLAQELNIILQEWPSQIYGEPILFQNPLTREFLFNLPKHSSENLTLIRFQEELILIDEDTPVRKYENLTSPKAIAEQILNAQGANP